MINKNRTQGNNINNNRYIFGPVPSRRLGISLGIDLIPFKTCSLDCVYCECGRTNNFTRKREVFVSVDTILKELKPYLDKVSKLDYITFSGSGEPTLNSDIGRMIDEIKKLTDTPIAVLTNGTLLDDPSVRRDLLNSDLVLPSLDAVTPEIFYNINRPAKDVDIRNIIDGIIKFRSEYSGKIWLEIFIAAGINDSDEELANIYKTILRINPDKVQLNTLDRPPAYENIKSIDMDTLDRIKENWKGLQVDIIKRIKKRDEILSFSENLENNILNTIVRRPLTIDDLSELTGKNRIELYKYIDVLIKEKKIKEKIIDNKIFLIPFKKTKREEEIMSDRMVKQFMDMVRIDSESGNEEKMINYLVEEFTKIGAKAEKDDYGNLIAKMDARGCSGKDPILLSCHADTVLPGTGIEPVIEDGVIRSKGDTILGADDKAGIAEMLEALRIAEIMPPIEIAISRQEEVGLLGVKNLDFSKITAKKGFLLDNDTLDTIVIGGPSYFAIDVNITGKAAHAGMEPEKGISAIQAAAKAISALRLGRLDEDTTANVGIINGGMIRNGIPDKTTFMAECRSLIHDKAKDLAKEMTEIIEREVMSVGARVEIKVNNLCKAVDIPADSETVEISKKALKSVGIDAETTFITGFTDASIYNNKGIEVAVVGIGAKLEHSTDEHIYIDDMNKAIKMIIEILRLSAQ